MTRTVSGDVCVLLIERMTADAMRLLCPSAIALSVAVGTYRLHIKVMLGRIA
jgi:hypothetical protein